MYLKCNPLLTTFFVLFNYYTITQKYSQMGKGKLAKFAEMETFSNVFQYPFSVIDNVRFEQKGRWREDYFHNDKGARMWAGAKLALQENLSNVAFLRTNIEFIDRFFDKDEVQEIWLTFSDPQMKNVRKRLTGTAFMDRYKRFLVDNGIIHLKTDSNFLFTYTQAMVKHNQLPVKIETTDLYHDSNIDDSTKQLLSIQTYYEKMWLERGLNIKYMRFLLLQEGELTEPDVEIPLDEYRSYHRSKRSELETSK